MKTRLLNDPVKSCVVGLFGAAERYVDTVVADSDHDGTPDYRDPRQ